MKQPLVSLAFLVFACVPLVAQVDHASLSGLTDASGAVVAGANVETLSAETAFRRQTITGRRIYQIPGLPIGMYTVTFSQEGFKPTEVKRVELVVGQPRTIDAQLEVGPVTDAVEVTASLETLNRTSAEVRARVEAAQIKEIPVDGRNWASLMLLVPGAINYGDAGERAIQFNGHSLDAQQLRLRRRRHSAAYRSRRRRPTPGRTSPWTPSPIPRQHGCLYRRSGRCRGAQVSVVSKSGSNDYHGAPSRPAQRPSRMPARRSTLHAAFFHAEPVGASFPAPL